MLLEMPRGALLPLLESPAALGAQIEEALGVLRRHATAGRLRGRGDPTLFAGWGAAAAERRPASVAEQRAAEVLAEQTAAELISQEERADADADAAAPRGGGQKKSKKKKKEKGGGGAAAAATAAGEEGTPSARDDGGGDVAGSPAAAAAAATTAVEGTPSARDDGGGDVAGLAAAAEAATAAGEPEESPALTWLGLKAKTPLTLAMLTSATPEHQQTMIRERLDPLIVGALALEPALACKITGIYSRCSWQLLVVVRRRWSYRSMTRRRPSGKVTATLLNELSNGELVHLLGIWQLLVVVKRGHPCMTCHLYHRRAGPSAVARVVARRAARQGQ